MPGLTRDPGEGGPANRSIPVSIGAKPDANHGHYANRGVGISR